MNTKFNNLVAILNRWSRFDYQGNHLTTYDLWGLEVSSFKTTSTKQGRELLTELVEVVQNTIEEENPNKAWYYSLVKYHGKTIQAINKSNGNYFYLTFGEAWGERDLETSKTGLRARERWDNNNVYLGEGERSNLLLWCEGMEDWSPYSPL